MKTCCEHHADAIPCGCNQGRACPARKADPMPDAYAALSWVDYTLITIVSLCVVGIVGKVVVSAWPILAHLFF